MYLFITILILIASIFLILIVLVQNSKGGGLIFWLLLQLIRLWESERQPILLEKATWTLAGTVVILSIVASAFLPSANTGSHGSEIKDAIKKEIPATAQPGFETQQTTAPIAQPDSAK